jgi:hypothetical protein
MVGAARIIHPIYQWPCSQVLGSAPTRFSALLELGAWARWTDPEADGLLSSDTAPGPIATSLN